MLQTVLDTNGKVRLDIQSMDGCSITNVKIRDNSHHGYDEKRELPFMRFDAEFMFKGNGKTRRLMHIIKYHNKKEFVVLGILIHFNHSDFSTDFYFHHNEIKENLILTKLAKEMETLCRIPIVTNYSINCTEWSMKRREN